MLTKGNLGGGVATLRVTQLKVGGCQVSGFLALRAPRPFCSLPGVEGVEG